MLSGSVDAVALPQPDPVRAEAAILELAGVSKTFPGVRALSEVDLRLYPGQVTALVGENGAGKSTMVKILTGIYQPDGGSIRIDDTDIRDVTLESLRCGTDQIKAACGSSGFPLKGATLISPSRLRAWAMS